jgi:hypothetical protein
MWVLLWWKNIVSESTALMKVFEPIRDEVSEQYRMLHKKELHDLYRSPSFVRIEKSLRS